jgi:hypothetical protein
MAIKICVKMTSVILQIRRWLINTNFGSIASPRLFIICTKSRHIIHFMNTTTNWPPKRSMMYAILFKTKRNWNNPDVSLSLPFFLILIDASYFWNYSDTDSIIIIQLKYSWKLVTLYCGSFERTQCSVTFSYIKHKTTSNKNEETLK